MSVKKTRLDLVIVEKGLVQSRQRARALIMAGKVLVNNRLVDKPGSLVYRKDDVILKGEEIPYVSRGGLKLEKALQALNIDITGAVCLDVGASTGGFTAVSGRPTVVKEGRPWEMSTSTSTRYASMPI